jgi:F-type H+-transporting ATPase subunit b
MKFDWFTILAQIVNFAVLVYLLKRFLYHPILRIMKEREDKVRETILSADQKVTKAEKEFDSLKSERQELNKNKEQILKESNLEAEKQRNSLLEEAKKEIESKNEIWKKAQQNEWEEFHQDLRTQIQNESLEISKIIIHQLADSDLQEKILNQFIKKIRTLPNKDKANDKQLIKSIIVRSAMEVTEAQGSKLKEAIIESIGNFQRIQFEVKKGLIAGIELIVDTKKLVWTFDGMIDTYSEDLFKFTESNKKNAAKQT